MDSNNPILNADGFMIIKPKYSTLYKKTNYLAPLTSMVNTIYEYDIRMANVSVLREAKALPKKTLDRIANMPGQERKVVVGKLMRSNPELKTIVSSGITKAKRMLFEANQLVDADILSIKNDAVFVIGRKLKITKFGSVEFIQKNKFSVYHKIGSLEFYYDGREDDITVKGMSDSLIESEHHQKGMVVFLREVFRYLKLGRTDSLREYLVEFTDDYKGRRLPVEYYRELNHDNIYRLYELNGYTFNLTDISPDQLPDVNIVYNYMYYILPLIRLYI